jgi:shikimate 5-dehydrogenase
MNKPTVNELFDLSGKTALITGASGWLGRAFAEALAEAGANVVATSRDETTAKAIAAKLPTASGNIHHGVALNQLDGSIFSSTTATAAMPKISPPPPLMTSMLCWKMPPAISCLPAGCATTSSSGKPLAVWS